MGHLYHGYVKLPEGKYMKKNQVMATGEKKQPSEPD